MYEFPFVGALALRGVSDVWAASASLCLGFHSPSPPMLALAPLRRRVSVEHDSLQNLMDMLSLRLKCFLVSAEAILVGSSVCSIFDSYIQVHASSILTFTCQLALLYKGLFLKSVPYGIKCASIATQVNVCIEHAFCRPAVEKVRRGFKQLLSTLVPWSCVCLNQNHRTHQQFCFLWPQCTLWAGEANLWRVASSGQECLKSFSQGKADNAALRPRQLRVPPKHPTTYRHVHFLRRADVCDIVLRKKQVSRIQCVLTTSDSRVSAPCKAYTSGMQPRHGAYAGMGSKQVNQQPHFCERPQHQGPLATAEWGQSCAGGHDVALQPRQPRDNHHGDAQPFLKAGGCRQALYAYDRANRRGVLLCGVNGVCQLY